MVDADRADFVSRLLEFEGKLGVLADRVRHLEDSVYQLDRHVVSLICQLYRQGVSFGVDNALGRVSAVIGSLHELVSLVYKDANDVLLDLRSLLKEAGGGRS